MQKVIPFIAFIVLFFNNLSSQTTRSVLFIGNSYTATNNLPSMLANMAKSVGHTLLYDANTPGGQRFMNHASNATTLNKIKSKKWDFVVLQAQSQETSWEQSQMQDELYPYAQSLCQAIRDNHECSQPLFYMTWGRKNGDELNCPFVPWVCTYKGMDSAINITYRKMASDNLGQVAPVGAAWRYIREQHPNIELYQNDNSHPSVAGSYLAACVFYSLVYQSDPDQISWNSNLSNEVADTLKAAARRVAYNHLGNFDFSENQALATFTDTVYRNQVKLDPKGSYFDSLLWDFGDGQFSTDTMPTHNYDQIGTYTISLSTYKCGKMAETAIDIKIKMTVQLEESKTGLKVYPNPCNSTLWLQGLLNQEAFVICNAFGQTVMQGQLSASHTIDVQHLPNGTYLLALGNASTIRFVIID